MWDAGLQEQFARLAISALPILFAITVHEAAHGFAALCLGDSTAARAGRITLNPLAHIDAFGTVALPLLLFFLTGGKFLFGYAKPVPVNFQALRRPKQDILWVAAAGPLVNFLMAALWFFLWSALPNPPESGVQDALLHMCAAGVQINLVLMALNLFPLLPLDGGRILFSLLPARQAFSYARTEPYGFMILIVLLWSGVLEMILTPFIDGCFALFQFLF
ncbi:MAG: site-2 protease family protein [Zoogloeaceae bacterium]|jgi:Zn-dependent protease|nr:site-2 protease family protein [Zoogloeaceae bacterium]